MKRSSAPAARPQPIRKERTILFAKVPPGQVAEADDLLGGLSGLEHTARPEYFGIDVAYDLHVHSLEELEETLIDKGFHLDSTLMSKLMRALIHYVEETQIHNLDAPQRLLKRSQNEVYTQAWERRPHGDHDDTPPEWREYK